MAKTIRDLMTENPCAIDSNKPVAHGAKMMRDESVGLAPIVEGQKLVGTLTDRDIAIRVVAEGKDPQGMSKERAAKIANSPGASSRSGKKSHSGSSRSNSSQGGTTAQKKAAAARAAAQPRARAEEEARFRGPRNLAEVEPARRRRAARPSRRRPHRQKSPAAK